MLRIGLVGLGFMGKMHFETYARLGRKAKVVALCDKDAKKRAGDWSAIGGNIATGKAKRVDLGDAAVYADWRKMIADPNVDVVDITLPTDLHAEVAIAALKAGKHVICEKPMARTSAEAKRMCAAAKAAKRRLFVGQCIRFWPAYEKLADLVKTARYGKVRSAQFRRLSPLPIWSADNWLQDAKRSGLAPLDFHIHDADFIQHLFGAPRAVSVFTGGCAGGRADHIVARYQYPGDLLVVAEGAWLYEPAFPFSMTFVVKMDKATVALDAAGVLTVYTGQTAAPVKLDPESGYYREIAHFLDCIEKNAASPVLSPESAARSVALIEAEMKSARTGRPVRPAK
jgi:predicted dehydrogenase